MLLRKRGNGNSLAQVLAAGSLHFESQSSIQRRWKVLCLALAVLIPLKIFWFGLCNLSQLRREGWYSFCNGVVMRDFLHSVILAVLGQALRLFFSQVMMASCYFFLVISYWLEFTDVCLKTVQLFFIALFADMWWFIVGDSNLLHLPFIKTETKPTQLTISLLVPIQCH